MNRRRALAALAPRLDEEHITDRYLYGYRLILARIVLGGLTAFALIVFIASLPVYYTQLHVICQADSCASGQLTPTALQTLHQVGISIDGYALFRLISNIVSAMVSFVVAGLLASRKRDEWMALLAAFMLVMLGVVGITNMVGASDSSWQLPARLLDVLTFPTYFLVFMVFPDGRFIPRWTRWLVIAFLALSIWYSFFPTVFTTNSWLNVCGAFLFVGLIISLPLTQIYRYRYVSTSLQRQQTKWVVFGFCLGVALEFVPYTLTLILPPFNQSSSLYQQLFNPDAGGNLLDLLLPLSFGVAILRYRLWDIDVLINRTLVYGTLTALLALVYFVLVIGLQFLLRELTGQVSSSPLVIVSSTLAIAALFQVARKRIQSIIDRRFYRRKYDAARTLAAFSTLLSHEVDLDQLSEQLVAIVEETMQPAHVSLWLPEHRKE